MKFDYRFVQPVDTVSIRGNRLFGEAGSDGDTTFPPRPSVLSGAFRSSLLAQADAEIIAFTEGNSLSEAELAAVLGTPDKPGSFSIAAVFPARLLSDGSVETLMQLPMDLVVTEEGKAINKLVPQSLPDTIQTSQISELPLLPVLRQNKQSKPESGWLLNHQGMAAYVASEALLPEHLEKQENLWSSESRTGIGLNTVSRTADQGKLFTVEHTVTRQSEHDTSSAGLLVGLVGCGDVLADAGFIRLGGDGRAAHFNKVEANISATPLDIIRERKRFKLILHTPGLFASGWLPDSVLQSDGHYRLEFEGFSARLCSAALSRTEVVSGWDLAKWRPKPAERAVPAGSVYWFDEIEGDVQSLGKLSRSGLWPESLDNSQRWAEGYNRVLIAAW